MAFEWKKKLGVCTLKSRSLNGTITKVEGEVFFGLCLDHGDFFISPVLISGQNINTDFY